MATDFKCANNLCLPNSVKCDGYNHCGDGSDEAELCGAFSFTVVKFIRHMDNSYILETRLYVYHTVLSEELFIISIIYCPQISTWSQHVANLVYQTFVCVHCVCILAMVIRYNS